MNIEQIASLRWKREITIYYSVYFAAASLSPPISAEQHVCLNHSFILKCNAISISTVLNSDDVTTLIYE